MLEEILGPLSNRNIIMFSSCRWEHARRDIAILSGDTMKINVKIVLEFRMFGTYFLDCAVVFDTPF